MPAPIGHSQTSATNVYHGQHNTEIGAAMIRATITIDKDDGVNAAFFLYQLCHLYGMTPGRGRLENAVLHTYCNFSIIPVSIYGLRSLEYYRY